MTEGARVTSLEALTRFRAFYGEFGEEAALAVRNAEADVQRNIWWLQQEQLKHWQMQIRKREKIYAQAKSDLASGELRSEDLRPSLVVERRAVEKARRMLEEAHQKVERVRYWSRILEREFLLYKGQTQALATRLERDVPRGMARLATLIDRLHEYVKMAPPASSPTAAPPEGEDPETAESGEEAAP